MTELLPEIHLCDMNAELVEQWKDSFGGVPRVHIAQQDITSYPVPVDAIVSPANSFGFMTGGIDGVYLRWFGVQVMENVQAAIDRDFYGELSVGEALIALTGRHEVKYCISAPTMRSPGLVPPLHAYLAFRAAIIAVLRHNKAGEDTPIESILCPGLGTLTGGITPRDAAEAMRLAYDQVAQHLGLIPR